MTAPIVLVRHPAPLRTQVRDVLREAIVQMRFKPGQRLVERELCELVGVSRTVIREVLRELEAEGLVQTNDNRGPTVAGLMSPEETQGLYEARAVLEGLAARCCAERASDEEVAALRAAFEEVKSESLSGQGVPQRMLAAKARFYAALLAGARNDTVTSLLRTLRDRITALRAMTMVHPGRPLQTIAELEALVQAVEARDPVGAWQASLAHVMNAAQVAQTLLRAGLADEGAAANGVSR